MRRAASVRRLVIASLFLGSVLIPGVASSHGSCTTTASTTMPGGQVKATATISCGSSHTLGITVTLQWWNAGAWQVIGGSNKNGTGPSLSTNYGPVNCVSGNVYRSLGASSGSPGGHGAAAQSSIKTCP